MGRSLAEAFPESRRVFDAADEALGVLLSRVCFEGPDDALALTETTQPAILTHSVAALRALEARGVHPAATAGHSLGEYSAHVAAGTLDFVDAVRTVRLRGRFMQEAVPAGEGAMAAVIGLDEDQVSDICTRAADGEVVSAANLNGPRQVVIAGHTGAVARAVELAQQAGARRAVLLNVSAPFHCPLMKPAADRLAELLAGVTFRQPAVPVWVNVDAVPVESGAAARDAIVRQVASPVRWQQIVEGLIDTGHTAFLEVGPGTVLAGLARRIRKDVEVLSVSGPEGVEAAAARFGGRE
jgi:[acyl-carrier-protein] S-malonyltransferase